LITLVNAAPATYRAATTQSRDGAKTCCSAQRTCCEPTNDDSRASHAEPMKRPTKNDTVLGLSALVCHGFGTNWLAAVVALPPAVVNCVQPVATEAAIALPPIQFYSPAFPPPVPPPRLAFS
jgi:hypothetical protein